MEPQPEQSSNRELINQQERQALPCLVNEQQNENSAKVASKKQKKKIEKKAKWQQQRKQKRIEKKQRDKQKKLKKKQQKSNQQEQIDNLTGKADQQQIQKKCSQSKQKSDYAKKQQQGLFTVKRKDDYKNKMKGQLNVVIDLQFYSLMTQKEKYSLIKQLSYCHSVNRKAEKPFNFIISSAAQQAHKDLQNKYNANHWGITIEAQDILKLYPKQRIVYLTGDAKDQLQAFDQNDIYIIGGIVDHNRLKNITINYAQEHCIRSKRLSMQGIQLRASVHIAVNHVWQWMLRVYNGQTWANSIRAVIPSRKIKNGDEKQIKQNNQKIEP